MVDRRTLLAGGVQLCGAAAALPGLYIVGGYLSPVPKGLGDEEVSIREDELPSGSSVQVLHKGKPVLIVRDNDGKLYAMSAKCTHLGCIVKWDQVENRVKCPCHDALFTLDGEVISGPAPGPLTKVAVGIEGGLIKLES